jgi:hypothetical protein
MRLFMPSIISAFFFGSTERLKRRLHRRPSRRGGQRPRRCGSIDPARRDGAPARIVAVAPAGETSLADDASRQGSERRPRAARWRPCRGLLCRTRRRRRRGPPCRDPASAASRRGTWRHRPSGSAASDQRAGWPSASMPLFLAETTPSARVALSPGEVVGHRAVSRSQPNRRGTDSSSATRPCLRC